MQLGSWYWRLSTVPRLLYIRRLVLWLLEKQDDLTINASVLMGSKFILVLTMSLHWVGCFCFVMSMWNGLNENSWPAYISDHVFSQYDPSTADALQHYLQIFYKALDMMTLTGVYFSPPDNALEVVMAVIVMVVQIFLGSYIFGSLLHILVFKDYLFEEHTKVRRGLCEEGARSSSRRVQALKHSISALKPLLRNRASDIPCLTGGGRRVVQRMHMLQFFCKQHTLPPDLRRDLSDHFTYQFQRTRASRKARTAAHRLCSSLRARVRLKRAAHQGACVHSRLWHQ
jgi:hypothetical protein